jgi:hypothetical protein
MTRPFPLQEQRRQSYEERLIRTRPDCLPFYPGYGKFRDHLHPNSGMAVNA